ncbi:MAG: hypothetical protein AB7M12_02690 [Hyphomonadaceae bacterium]
MRGRYIALLMAAACFNGTAWAQRAAENATRTADDAFGVTIGNETIGLYADRDTRGFSPLAAGNLRIEGLYFDMRALMPSRVLANTTIRVGLSAQNYPFPAPTGIVDYTLRSVSDRNAFSTVLRYGPNNGYFVEMDGERTLVPGKLGVSAGFLAGTGYAIKDLEASPRAIGFVARWRPTPGTEITPFYSFARAARNKANPLVFSSGPFTPPKVKMEFFGQDWTAVDTDYQTYGVRVRQPLSTHWELNSGLFRHTLDTVGANADLYLNTDQNGLAATHLITDEQAQHQPITTGETRLTGVFTGERFRQTIHLSVRGRHSQRKFGGTAQTSFGPLAIGEIAYLDEPQWTYGPQSKDTVRQWAAGLQYQLALKGVGEASIGLQQTDYTKTITRPTGLVTTTQDDPFFVNAALALTPTRKLAFYGSITEGLEEVAAAPENAVNVNEAPPAIHTKQYDFGLRYALTPQLRAVLGYFNVRKPYFNLDQVGVYRSLGDEVHKGVEFSLAGRIGERVNVVAGAVLQKPEVSGEAVTSGLVGSRPVSQAETTLKLNLDYRTPWVEGLSVDAQVIHTGKRAATTRSFVELGGRQLDAEAFTTVDLGMRYRFKIAAHSSTFRAQILNVFDDFAWRVFPSGAFYLANPRGFQMSLATDF